MSNVDSLCYDKNMSKIKSTIYEAMEMAKFARAKGINPAKVYNLVDVQKFLKISERTAYRLMKRGVLKYVRIPGKKGHEILGEWILACYSERNFNT